MFFQTQGVCLEATQHKFEGKDEDLQRCSHHHFVVRFWVLDALGNRLDETRGFCRWAVSAEYLGVTRRDQLRNDTIRYRCMDQPTVGKRIQWNRLRWFGHMCWMDDSRLPKQLLWAERPDGWRCPPILRQGNNGRIRSLPTWRLIYPGAFTVTPWWRPSAWQLSAAHGGGYGMTSPASTYIVTNQASARIQMSPASLDKSRSDPTRKPNIQVNSDIRPSWVDKLSTFTKF